MNQAAPSQHQQLPLLNAVWKLVTKIPDVKDYLSTARIWLEFTAKHFTVNTEILIRMIAKGHKICKLLNFCISVGVDEILLIDFKGNTYFYML